MHYYNNNNNNYYYFFIDSNSCGPNGAKTKDKGRACIIEYDNLDEFVRICKHTGSNKNVWFTLDYIGVEFFDIPVDVMQPLLKSFMEP